MQQLTDHSVDQRKLFLWEYLDITLVPEDIALVAGQYVTRFEISWLTRTQQQDTIFTIKQ